MRTNPFIAPHRMAGLVPAVRRVDLNEGTCYESSLRRIQVSGSEMVGVETSGVVCGVVMNVQSPELRSNECGDGRTVLSRSSDSCVDSNAGVGGNDCGISVVVGRVGSIVSRC